MRNEAMNKVEFLQWEKTTKDVIDLKRTYIDLFKGDIVTGLLLSQIVYWHLPGKGGKTKLRVNKNGKYYLVKRRKDWFEECRISEEKYKRAIKKLKELGIIETEVRRYSNSPTTHILFKWDRFLELIDKEINTVSVKTPETEKVQLPKTKTVKEPETLTKTFIDYPIQNTVTPPYPGWGCPPYGELYKLF